MIPTPPHPPTRMARLCREKFSLSFTRRKRWCCSKLVCVSFQQIPIYFIPLDVLLLIKACRWPFILFFLIFFACTFVLIDKKKFLWFQINFVLFWCVSHYPILNCLGSFKIPSESIVIKRRIHILHLITNSFVLFQCLSFSFLHEGAYQRRLSSGTFWNRTLYRCFCIV